MPDYNKISEKRKLALCQSLETSRKEFFSEMKVQHADPEKDVCWWNPVFGFIKIDPDA